jgi:transposase
VRRGWGGAFRKIGEAPSSPTTASCLEVPLARKPEQSQLRPVLLTDEDFAHWYAAGTGRPSVPPSLVAGAFLLALREGCSDREAEQRMRFDLRWKWALGLGVGDHGCDHTTICVFRGRLLAYEEEGRLFAGIQKRVVEAVQDTYNLLRTALHKVVKAHAKAAARDEPEGVPAAGQV